MTHDTHEYLWRSGRIIRSEEATVHVRSVGHASVSAVFEGVGAYWNADHEQLYVFRLRDHMERLAQSARLAYLTVGHTPAELEEATLEMLRRNQVRHDTHIRLWSFAAGNPIEQMVPRGAPCETVIDSWPSRSGLVHGRTATAAFTSWTRIGPNSMPPFVKAFSNYHNGRLGNIDAREKGADWPIFINAEGHVTESSGACVGMFRDGVFHTPSLDSGILHSVTRATLLELLREMDIPVQERRISRSEMSAADEVIFIGTSAEVLPIVRLDGCEVGGGGIGPLTARLRAEYLAVLRGERPHHADWLSPVWPQAGEARAGAAA